MAECNELCVVYQFAGLYKLPHIRGGGEGNPIGRWKGQIGCPIAAGNRRRDLVTSPVIVPIALILVGLCFFGRRGTATTTSPFACQNSDR